MVQKRIKNEEYRTIEDFQKGQGSTNGRFSPKIPTWYWDASFERFTDL